SGTPDSDEDNEGMPIIEKKGELFNNILSAANLTRSLVYIAPIIPWKINGNRDLTSEEKIMLLPIIKKHIEIINPKILIFLGLEPIKYLLDNDGMMKMRGKWLNYNLEEKSIECLPILDPGFLIRRPEYKRETWNDILSLKEKIKELI
ncbi:MAG: uracil-DNA glycosylase, partial [Alphaproteobacteria bacterium]|nr:uracil-DNA glycosylase [Alphaproteobacteria bacterium]